ncbi:MAG: lamin tail domain-containing protein [Parcubacteria group bacterium]
MIIAIKHRWFATMLLVGVLAIASGFSVPMIVRALSGTGDSTQDARTTTVCVCQEVTQEEIQNGVSLESLCGDTPTQSSTPTPSSSVTATPSTTPTSSPSPTVAGTVAPTPTPTATQAPQPSDSNHIMISEVYYDVDAEHGNEFTNEWVELYNGTGIAMDLTGWSIADANTTKSIPDGTVVPHGTFALIVADISTSSLWNLQSEQNITIASLEGNIGNGLSNGGDAVYLLDSCGAKIDEVSWGSNTDVFDLSSVTIREGESLTRKNAGVDNDTSSDWTVSSDPTPGTY